MDFNKRFTKDEIAERIAKAKENLIDFSHIVPGLKAAGHKGSKPEVRLTGKRVGVNYAEYVEYHTPENEKGISGLATDAFAVDISNSSLKEFHSAYTFSLNADNAQKLLIVDALSAQFVTAQNAPLKEIDIEEATEILLTPETAWDLQGFHNSHLHVHNELIGGQFGFYFPMAARFTIGSFHGNAGDVIAQIHENDSENRGPLKEFVEFVWQRRNDHYGTDQVGFLQEKIKELGLVKQPQ